MILFMFTVAKAIAYCRYTVHGFARVERNTQRLLIIALRTASVKLTHKK